MSKIKNLIGQKFNELTVIERVQNDTSGHACWKCKCSCGNETICRGTELISGRRKSCGCLNNKDLSGKIFGRLKVIEYAYSKKGKRYWKCECECGNITYVYTNSLTSGNTKSC